MNVCDYITDKLSLNGVEHVFGIPGGVVLYFLNCLKENSKISSHLCFHEQGAAFAAVGYAQAKNSLGLAYATRGPGIMNMATPIADAYYNSASVIFLTGHSKKYCAENKFQENTQEFNLFETFKNITKATICIDDIKTSKELIDKAFEIALSPCKGPVVLDILEELWQKQI